jgi:hypothetical protein
LPASPDAPRTAASRSASPSPTPSAVRLSVVTRQPHDRPQILRVWLNTSAPHSGDRVVGRVTATSNVASVEVRVQGYSVSLEKTGVGKFEGAYTIPDIPPFLKGTYDLKVIARNVDGVQASEDVPIALR